MRFSVTYQKTVLAMLIMILSLFICQNAHSDRCSCPPSAETDAGKQVFEPAQRAVLLWNGREELLFLSTDLYSPQAGTMPEVLALPARPERPARPSAVIGNLDVYTKLADVVGPERLGRDWLPSAAVSLINHPPLIGNLSDPMFDWSIVNPCRKELNHYQSINYPWAVINLANIASTRQSFSPIEYRFQSDDVFYPLHISVGDSGHTQIDLIIITRNRISRLPTLEYPIDVVRDFNMSSDELSRVSPNWATFMLTNAGPGSGPLSLSGQHLRIRGDLAAMKTDFLAR